MQKPETLFKEISQLHSQNWDNAQRTAENAILIGIKFHQIKEQLPHGQFEEAARKATKVSDQTRTRYMRIAEERLIEQRAIKLLQEDNSSGGQKFHVALLDDPEMQAIPDEVRDQARAEICADTFSWTSQDIKPKEMVRGLDGKDIGDLYRDYDIIRAKKPKQHIAPKELSPDEKIAAENAQAAELINAAIVSLQLLITDLQSKTGNLALRVPVKLWKDILRTTTQFNKLARPLSKRKLSPQEKKQENQSKSKALLSAVESCQSSLSAGKITPEAKAALNAAAQARWAKARASAA